MSEDTTTWVCYNNEMRPVFTMGLTCIRTRSHTMVSDSPLAVFSSVQLLKVPALHP